MYNYGIVSTPVTSTVWKQWRLVNKDSHSPFVVFFSFVGISFLHIFSSKIILAIYRVFHICKILLDNKQSASKNNPKVRPSPHYVESYIRKDHFQVYQSHYIYARSSVHTLSSPLRWPTHTKIQRNEKLNWTPPDILASSVHYQQSAVRRAH